MQITVPPGPLGIAFRGIPPTITKVKEGSVLTGQVDLGDAVLAVILEDGTEHTDFTSDWAFRNLLKEHQEDAQRILVVEKKEVEQEPTSEQAPVTEEAAEEEEQGENEPETKDQDEEAVVDEKDSDVVAPVPVVVEPTEDNQEEKKEDDQENLVTDAQQQDQDSNDKDVAAVEKNVPSSPRKTVVLPVGSLGVSFRGSPPRIIKVNPSSVVSHELHPGQVVRKLILPDETVVEELDTPELVQRLNQYLDSDGGRRLEVEFEEPVKKEKPVEQKKEVKAPKSARKRGLFGKAR